MDPPEKKKGRGCGPLFDAWRERSSALARLETRVALADHENLAAAAHDLAVAVTGLERRQDFHGNASTHGFKKRAIVAAVLLDRK